MRFAVNPRALWLGLAMPWAVAHADEPDTAPEEITVEAAGGEHRAAESAEAVTRIELDAAAEQTVDLGQQLETAAGLTVQRSGGLGSSQRVALDGFGDGQVRLFLDGVPLAYTGLAPTLADVPLDLVDHLEVFHGVVPLRFGADALGGAIALESPEHTAGVHGRASVQTGSWGVTRASVATRMFHDRRGLGLRARAFFDLADNDWPIRVDVAEEDGSVAPAELPRRHARYSARGGHLGFEARDKRWADSFRLDLSGSDTSRQIPHNQVMTAPYGGVEVRTLALGPSMRWRHLVGSSLHIEAVAAYGYRRARLLDRHPTVVDWYGDDIRERPTPGELGDEPSDRLTWQHGAYGRMVATVLASPHHTFTVSLTPDLTWRSGDERLESDPDARDVWEADQRQLKAVLGGGWTGSFVDDDLEVQLFSKAYAYQAQTAGFTAALRYEEATRSLGRGGAGAALRYRLTPHLSWKTSYEYAARLPGPDEVFGDGVLVIPNLELVPEVSHNANVELQFAGVETSWGRWLGGIRGIGRWSDDLIVLLTRDVTQQFQNVVRARTIGVQGHVAWETLDERLTADAAGGWLDQRNRSQDGVFQSYAGDRLPNRPWLDANGSITARTHRLGNTRLSLEGMWMSRYIHPFFRTWESVGLVDSKQRIPAQLTHRVGVRVRHEDARGWGLTASLEVDNLSNARVYDVFGVQLAGRSIAAKLATRW